MKVYNDAIRSAKTKFDACEAYFAKGEAGKEEYIALMVLFS